MICPFKPNKISNLVISFKFKKEPSREMTYLADNKIAFLKKFIYIQTPRYARLQN